MIRSRLSCVLLSVFLFPALADQVGRLDAVGEGGPSLERLTPALPRIPGRTFRLADFGAVGDGKTLNTDAFKEAVAAVEKAGGGRLVVPKGVFRTRPFTLCSNLDLHLEGGAVIQAPDTLEALGLPDPRTLKSQADVTERVKVPDPLISGRNLHDVAVTGSGTIDGSGRHWWEWSERAARAVAGTEPGRIVYPRPNLVVISGCERLRVADVTLANSSKFHLVPSNVTDLTIERVKVRAPFDAPNTDAIDVGPGTNFLVRDCDIDTGDDDIVIKNGGTNILIENNRIRHGHGISIGSGTTAGIHHMLVRHCRLEGTDNGIRIKSMRGAGGPVDDVRYTDIRMKNVPNAIVFILDYVDNNRPDFKGDPTKVPSIRDVLVDNATIEGSENAGRIAGLPDSPIRGVTFRKVRITAENDLVIKDLFLAKARALKVDVPASELDTAYAEARKNIPEDAFQQELAKRNLTAADMREGLRRELVGQHRSARWTRCAPSETHRTGVPARSCTWILSRQRAGNRLIDVGVVGGKGSC